MKTTNTSKVNVIETMGSDLTVVNAARVSFDKESEWVGDDWGHEVLLEKDKKLINYLAKNNHWTPFAHVMVTLRISTPVFVARQWFRHTVGVARNEVSRRYVDDAPTYYLPDEIRARPEGSVKQGSGDVHLNSVFWREQIEEKWREDDAFYQTMIDDGVAPEQARMVLPLAHMTEFYETASLAFYSRVAGLRLDPHAQEEIRGLMLLVVEAIEPIAPVSWKALMSA